MVKELILFYFNKISITNWILYVLLGVLIALIDAVFLSTLFPFFKNLFLDQSFSIEINYDYGIIFEKIIEFIEHRFISIFFLIIFFKGFFNYIEVYTSVLFQQKFEVLNRIEIIRLFLKNPPKDLVSLDQGKSNNIFLNQANELKIGYRQFTIMLRRISYLFIYLFILVFLFGVYGLIVSLILIFSPLVFSKIFNQTRNISKRKSAEDDQLGNSIFESISFLKYMILTGLTEKFLSRLGKNIKELATSNIKMGRNDAIVRSFREPLFVAIIIMLFFVSKGFDLKQNNLLLLSLLAYRISNYTFELYSAFNEFLKSYGSVINQKILSKSFNELNDTGIEINKIERIGFKNLSFQRLDKRLNYKINLEIIGNDKIIIIGESGSGKTTIFNTLLGINNKFSGSININGIDLLDIKVSSIRNKVGFVDQNPIMFNDSLYNNISLWDRISDNNIKKVKILLKEFQLERFSEDLFQKNINFKEKLSGGEKQRLNLIRELYKDPEILFLDEITSALDKESKIIIFNYLNNLKLKMVLITHDLESIKFFNPGTKVLEITNY